jgi:hypothetical protein
MVPDPRRPGLGRVAADSEMVVGMNGCKTEDCIPEKYPCDQNYGDHWASQPPTRWVLDLATALVSFRLRALQLNATDEAYYKVYEAGHMMHNLVNQRWCNIVRDKSCFMPYEPKGRRSSAFAFSEGMEDLLAAVQPKRSFGTIRRR